MEEYPDTDYGTDARYKIDLIIDQLAAKEMSIARYYMKTEKWIPALNRLRVVVDKYDTTVFVEDDTIPQNDEGTEIMTLAITPVSATSTMYIATQIFHSNGATTRTGIGLFKDSDANALAFTSVFIKDPTSMGNGVLRYAEVTGNTTARTYKVRIGGMGSSTITFNGQSRVRKFGGIDTLSSIQILEVEA